MTVLHADHAFLPGGWARDVRLTLADGAIASVKTGAAPQPGDVRHAALVPGLPNLHSHAFQYAMAGLAERRGPGSDSFWSWREQMYRFALTMTPDDVEAVAGALYCAMLEAGFTRVGEFHYLHHDRDGRPYADPAEMATRIAAAAATTGIGLTLLPVFYAHAGFGAKPPAEGQRRFISDLDLFARMLDGAAAAIRPLESAVLGIAPHSLRAVAPGQLARLVEMAPAGPVHIHVAEQVLEVDDCLAWSGRRPVAWLLDHAPVDRRWCLIHATHMLPEETRALAATGAVAGLCPVTEANLGDGIFDAPEFLGAGGRFGVGSDSNVEIGVPAELRMLEYSQRLGRRARNVIAAPGGSTGETLYAGALAGGTQALGATVPSPGEHAAGLTAGAPADIVALAPTRDLPAAPETLFDSWIFAGGWRVDAVRIAGRLVVENGRHRARDAIMARHAATMRTLLA
ncbi:formimidoylglutamate deiminase [Prosthecodimorpha staleyi]|uniref:Formimidoylglutamate deiminase n=1 Tax=Prosthecodimorpha staleyi TaxID=2840188 RepID=A0A947DA75_9HYPH|nr:formimidoylglutamate deiminase [Prosthecodimorpha staleyi]MBT9292796.1 formimidoylglutamate deiminase [Prosthecodimorpha staleyi]